MKKFTAALIALFTVCQLSHAQPKDASRHVILISVDGLAHYYFDDPKAPMPTQTG